MIFGIIEIPKSKKLATIFGGLVDTKSHMYCWRCGGIGHIKKDISCPNYSKDTNFLGKAKKKEEKNPKKEKR